MMNSTPSTTLTPLEAKRLGVDGNDKLIQLLENLFDYQKTHYDMSDEDVHNVSPALLKTAKVLLEFNLIHVDRVDDNYKFADNFKPELDLPTQFLFAHNYAIWSKSSQTHRDNDLPAVIDNGQIQWYQYGVLHRVNGPAIVAEQYVKRQARAQPNGLRYDVTRPYHLFGIPLQKEAHEMTVNYHNSFKMPLEIAYLMVVNGIDPEEWDVDPRLPLKWQIKALGEIAYADLIKTWLWRQDVFFNH